MIHRFRFLILILLIISIYGFLGANLYNLQIQKGSYYSAKAESQFRLAGFLEPHRGTIYFTDKNNNAIPVAINKSYPVIFAVPKEIDDVEEAVKSLAPTVGLEEEKLTMLLQKKDLYQLLVKKATDDQVVKIKELNLPGIYIDNQEFRFYPFGSLAASLLGFVGLGQNNNLPVGKYGLELFYEDNLAGKPGEVKDKKVIQSSSGDDLNLTIDRNIQTRVEEILSDLVERFKAAGGNIIVEDPKTGKILTMASYPTFDPNNYSQAKIGNFLNTNVQAIYEPGSIFKMITMAIGLDTGAITPETIYYDNGELKVNDRIIKNWDLKAHGQLTMTQVIEKSVNTGAAFAEKKIGHQQFYDYLQKFGFAQSTQINLPGELIGDLKNLIGFKNPVHYATASFGQGISVTPLQLINAIMVIANGGHLMRPTVLTKDQPEEIETVISKEAADQATAMMENALTKAEIGKVDNYRLAGKTGTAQVPDFHHGGYSKDVIDSYIGFGPVSDPKFIILIKLDKPAGAPLAGQTVVPAFRELAQFILNYYNIPPDKL